MTDAPDRADHSGAEPDLAWQATIAAALARQGRASARASVGVGLAAIVLAIVLVHNDPSLDAAAVAGLSTLQAVLIAFGLHLGLRTGFDADLFAALAVLPDMAGFDRAMTGLALMPPAKAGRPMAARVAGVKRLLAWQGAGVGLQLVVLVALPIVGALR